MCTLITVQKGKSDLMFILLWHQVLQKLSCGGFCPPNTSEMWVRWSPKRPIETSRNPHFRATCVPLTNKMVFVDLKRSLEDYKGSRPSHDQGLGCWHTFLKQNWFYPRTPQLRMKTACGQGESSFSRLFSTPHRLKREATWTQGGGDHVPRSTFKSMNEERLCVSAAAHKKTLI